MKLLGFNEYLDSLGPMNSHVDPMLETPESVVISQAAQSLTNLSSISIDALSGWVEAHPEWVPVLALAVGLSRERLKNVLKHAFGTSNWNTVARSRPRDLIEYLDSAYGLSDAVATLRERSFTFGDLLTARAGSRVTASRAGAAGRKLEDEIEAVAVALGVEYQTRTRFTGRNGRTAPCDLVIPNATGAEIVVAAKGFDSTGSKLTDAVREIEEMADVRLARQYVIAVIDGIGWKSRQADLRRIHSLWETHQIDGMYTLSSLGEFSADIAKAATLRGLL